MKLDEETIARLIQGRDEPSILARERLFERIYQETAPRPTRQRLGWALGLSLAAVAGAVALYLRPPSSEFAARGGGAFESAFQPRCIEGPCRSGNKLVFEMGPLATGRHFAAFARRHDGTIVWYFPAADEKSIALSTSETPQLLQRAITLGPEHSPGRYELFGVFSERPLSRAELKVALGDELRGGPGVRVVRRSFEVLP
jgi:hypothetical protein